MLLLKEVSFNKKEKVNDMSDEEKTQKSSQEKREARKARQKRFQQLFLASVMLNMILLVIVIAMSLLLIRAEDKLAKFQGVEPNSISTEQAAQTPNSTQGQDAVIQTVAPENPENPQGVQLEDGSSIKKVYYIDP